MNELLFAVSGDAGVDNARDSVHIMPVKCLSLGDMLEEIKLQ